MKSLVDSTKYKFIYKGNQFEADLIIKHRNAQKRINLNSLSNKISFDGNKFLVTVGLGATEESIIKFIDEKVPDLVHKYFNKGNVCEIKKGSEFYLFGEKIYYFQVGNELYINGKYYKNIRSNTNVLIHINKYISMKLIEFLIEKQKLYENLMNIPEHKFSIKNVKSYWGQHNKFLKTISYSINLGKQTKEFIECTIIHELAHWTHSNHSKQFWNLVYKYKPKYKAIKANKLIFFEQ